MTLIRVKEHTRGVPDPFASIIEAKKPRFAAKWRVRDAAPVRRSLIERIWRFFAWAMSIGRAS